MRASPSLPAGAPDPAACHDQPPVLTDRRAKRPAGARTRLPETTYIELVRSLYATLLQATIMALSFMTVGLLVLHHHHDPGLSLIVLLGSFAAAARVMTIYGWRDQAAAESIDGSAARQLEVRFTIPYLIFAVLFGAFCSVAVERGPAADDPAVIGLLFGYGAGVVAGVSLRPWIGVPAILLATVPTIVIVWLQPDAAHQVLGLLIAVFTGGGIHAMLTRYQIAASDITMRRGFAMLARRDHLTGLPNRLSLSERFEAFAQAAGGVDIIAVHCLDLDRFKPVNDRFGHPVGDALLKAVADRLLGVVRESDFAARIGGDEFVVVQTQAKHPDEVKALATRIVQAIGQPYVIHGHDIQIGTSVGYALWSPGSVDLNQLVADADQALYAAKRRGGGIENFGVIPAGAAVSAGLYVAA